MGILTYPLLMSFVPTPNPLRNFQLKINEYS